MTLNGIDTSLFGGEQEHEQEHKHERGRAG